MAFRGYLLAPPLHSYSASAPILDYWQTRLYSEHNGVFSSAVVVDGGNSLVLITDHLGIGPLYYRRLYQTVLFSTNPRFLACAEDQPDLLAWRCLLQAGFIASDRTLTSAVSRIPAGAALAFTEGDCRRVPWFDFERLPPGTTLVGPKAVEQVEEAFRESMARCVRLQQDRTVVPLSSGHDSRRILAVMLQRNIRFEAATVRVFQKEHRDLDARFATEIARDFAFPHVVVEPAGRDQYVLDDRARRILVDAETQMHTWVMRLVQSLPRRPSVIFDGILGDILGNPGFRMAGLYHSPQRDIDVIADYCIAEVFDPVLRQGCWPSASDVRADLRAYLRQLGARANIAELAFVLLRQRRMTALWSQQLFPPGHVVVCPYADLQYLRLMLSFDPAGKHRTIFQKACLAKFWPEFAKYPGNRNIPEDLAPGSPFAEHQAIRACFLQLRGEIVSAPHGLDQLNAYLSRRGNIALALSGRHRAIAVRTSWYLTSLMELVSRQVRRTPCWVVENK